VDSVEQRRSRPLRRLDAGRSRAQAARALRVREGRDELGTGLHAGILLITSQSSIIVTYNPSDFPQQTLSQYGIEAQHPDVFLSALIQNSPQQFMGAINDLLAALKDPPVTLENRLELMRKLNLKQTARRVEEEFTG
jgi:hypothetical protein